MSRVETGVPRTAGVRRLEGEEGAMLEDGTAAITTVDGWIGGRTWDLCFFFGSSLLAALVGLLVVLAPVTLVPLWWLWLWLVEGPHMLATWQRLYFDPEERRRRRTLLAVSLLWISPGVVAWALTKVTGSSAPYDLFLLTAGLWSFHHTVRQHYGILAIYQWHARSDARARVRDRYFLHLSLWALFVLFLLGHPANHAMLMIPEAARGVARGLAALIGIAVVVAVVTYLTRVVRGRWRALFSEPSLRPALFLLFPVLALHMVTFLVLAPFEPLLPGANNPEQVFLAVGLLPGLVHGLQYLGIVFAANRRRFATPDRRPVARLGRAPLVAWLIAAGGSTAYLALVAARGISPGLSFFPEPSDAARLALAVYWGLFFHHYYLDQKVWHVGSDAGLQRELGLRA